MEEKILVTEWQCDLCGKIERLETSVPDTVDTPDDLPEWITRKLPRGWARDITDNNDYCEECWEVKFVLLMNDNEWIF